jgi:hypothetical protein
MTPDRLAYAGGVEPINGPDAIHPDMTTQQVNDALRALFERAESGRSGLIDAARELDSDTARALLVRQVVAVYAKRLPEVVP